MFIVYAWIHEENHDVFYNSRSSPTGNLIPPEPHSFRIMNRGFHICMRTPTRGYGFTISDIPKRIETVKNPSMTKADTERMSPADIFPLGKNGIHSVFRGKKESSEDRELVL